MNTLEAEDWLSVLDRESKLQKNKYGQDELSPGMEQFRQNLIQALNIYDDLSMTKYQQEEENRNDSQGPC